MATKAKALYLLEPKGQFEVREKEIPQPGPGEVLVQIHATALNPVDWKIHTYALFIENYPTILGLDSSGVIAKLGEGVTTFAVGDRVLHQGFFDNSKFTFQQYAIVPAEIVAKLPDNLSFDEGSTIPLAVGTAALGLYNNKTNRGIGLFPPWEEGGRNKYAGQPIFVYGGSSAVGQPTIQLAKLSGFSPIITTASKHNEAFLKSIGATHVIDRTLPAAAIKSAVRAITPEPIKVAYDAISLQDTQNLTYDILASGGSLVVVLDVAVDKERITEDKFIARAYGNVHFLDQRKVGVSLYSKLTELLAAGDVKPNNVEVVPNGLAGIPDGLEKLKKGVSASKLVARPQE
ncbi:hypothetical protein PHLGIDRAFT_182222 [Phlebiopsis gigantea 11061_1 CR5-6]|uniref:Enoyl reductase (ER) domain-containing protein n=1 Tax=Phlebiopsis gigantea (strain 11061_1 CR5-6) TaxID=745531 RepID=A0A0C3NIN7_PHLG1|nr:hypothetical protein PHLGIDRAFT_182222 [Phlebiopsis gigantea 11061_1 CR5-6]